MKVKLLSQDLDGFPESGVSVMLRLETSEGVHLLQGKTNGAGEVRFDLSRLNFSSASLWLEGKMAYSGLLTEKVLTYYV